MTASGDQIAAAMHSFSQTMRTVGLDVVTASRPVGRSRIGKRFGAPPRDHWPRGGYFRRADGTGEWDRAQINVAVPSLSHHRLPAGRPSPSSPRYVHAVSVGLKTVR